MLGERFDRVKWWPFSSKTSAGKRDTTGSATLVGDVWYAGSLPPSRSLWPTFTGTWRRRLGFASQAVRRVAAWTLGVETRHVESRAVTSVPWDQGGGFASAMSVDRALHLAPVFAAGRLLASSVASLPVQVYRKVGDNRQRLSLPRLLVSPSAVGTRDDWIWRAMTSLVYRGNAVGLITGRDADEHPTGVEWVDTDSVQVIDDQARPGQRGSFTNPIWLYQGQEVSSEDIVHIPWFTLPGRVWGLSPIAAYAATVSTGLSAQAFSKNWFDTGGVPPGTFQNANQTVDQADAEIIKDRLVQSIKSRKPIVYGKDWTYTPVTVSANEAKFVDTMRLTATQIAIIYGIPPEMIGGETGESMTYSTTEQQSIEFVQFTLLPWLTKLESHLSQLLPHGQFVKFNVDALIRVDASTRYANYKTAREIGLLSIDEIRALEDLPPLPSGLGLDYTPLDVLVKGIGSSQIRGDNTRRITGSE